MVQHPSKARFGSPTCLILPWNACWIVAVALSCLPETAEAQFPSSEAYAITGVEVILEPGKVLDNATVIVRKGVIEKVGVNLPAPFDAVEIKAGGMTVHAGLIDAGSTAGYDASLRPSVVGEVKPRDFSQTAFAETPEGDHRLMTPDFAVSRAIRWDEDQLEPWRLRGFTSRLVVPSGGILAGQSGLISLAGPPTPTALIRDGVAIHLAFESSGPEYPITLMGMIAHLRQTFLDAERHHQLQRMAEEGVEGALRPADDRVLEAVWPILVRQKRLAIAANSEDEIYRALAMADEFRARILIVGGAEAWKLAARLKEKDVPVIVSLNLPPEPKLSEPEKPPEKEKEAKEDKSGEKDKEATFRSDLAPRARREQHRLWLERLRGIQKLSEAGVTVAFSLEGVKPDEFHRQLELLVTKAGFPRGLAFELLTTGPAKALGVDDRIGSIAPGKLAHLVVRKGSPTDKESWVRQLFLGETMLEYEPVADASDKTTKKDSDSKPADREPSRPKDDGEPKKTSDAAKDVAKSGEQPTATASKEAGLAEIATEIEEDRKPAQQTGGSVLIKNVHVLTVAQAGDLPDADVKVADGKIAEIGEDLKADDGELTIDGRGLWMMPGIIDTHSHMAISGGLNESSLSITSEVRIKDVVNSKDLTIYRALAGGVTTARLLHGSANVIGGQDAVIKLKYGQPAPALLVDGASQGIKFALGENVKRTKGRFPNSRLGVEAVLTRAFSEARAYRRLWDDYQKGPRVSTAGPPPRRDLRLEALGRILKGESHIDCHCYRADEILMLLRVAEQEKIKVRSLQHALEAYKVAPEVASHGCFVSTFSDWWAYKWEAYDATPYNTALLREANVDVCLKSDSGEVVRHMALEAAKMLRYGLESPQEALDAITLSPARQLGLAHRIGSIEEGKDADVALYNGHPLNSYSRCVLTLVDGEIYFEDREFGLLKSRLLHGDSHPLELASRTLRDRSLLLPRSSNGAYALVHGTVYPVDRPPIADGTVLVREGKIEQVGADVELPVDATVIDVTGLRLYPGMIDAGAKVGLGEVGSAKETIDFGDIGNMQPDLRAASAIHPDSEVIPVTRVGGVTSVVTMPIGGVISGQSALVNLAGWVPREMVIVDPLALAIHLPEAPTAPDKEAKPFTGRGRLASRRTRQLQEIRSLFHLASHYQTLKAEAAKRRMPVPIVDPRMEALGPYLRKEKPVVFQANSEKDIREAVDLADELAVRPIIRGARDAWKLAAELKRRDIPVIVGPVLTEVGSSTDPYDAPFRNLSRLHAAGVRFCLQTDQTANARNLPFEAATAVAFGLPAEEGLKAVTMYSAQILGVESMLGTLAAGKIANVIITDGDPLQAATRVKGLFIAGRPIEPTSKHTRLYERYLERLKDRPSIDRPASPTPSDPKVAGPAK